ncbi:MAG: DNA-directed RNA polymerase subunit H [Candidatus Odinarchaeum yellowstonii]|jgi:DNA-directed RNA polymerase subunit H|uniref:DNA-directed RNA polymerase subunit Rpo5 n=1 Tax=Odinarchaeota yellowstonii (strain LCB_4) TaxID=1841599 RepID=A0AAF0IBQ6_ODILC|nr:MAG: DNA-directed RNA polymerase subunit H [Candidatus Odinarchaeum yellowstonii]
MVDSILDNILVPKHIILSEAEAKEVLEKLRVKPYQLPKIFISDPAIKALNQKVKPGDIVKIIRSSPTAGESIAYRVVIE